MSFYDLPKEERTKLVVEIQYQLQEATLHKNVSVFVNYFSNEDTYIRKAAYLGLGRIYNAKPSLRNNIIGILNQLLKNQNELIRQTVANAAGEIGMFQFKKVKHIFDTALFDAHHKVRNAVIGSVKKMSQKNPKPTLDWAKKYINHKDKEIRRQVCHGIELRGRTHPEDILPLLKTLQFEKTKRVRDTLIHVIGQISYKEGCLTKVISELNNWKDKDLVFEAQKEIIDVHSKKRYAKFSALNQNQVINYIDQNLN